MPIAEIRNLAYDADPAKRKAAYNADGYLINCYKDINLTPEMLGQSSNPTVEEGEDLYMMVGELADDPRNTPDADHLLIANGYISVVAHNIDCTDYEVLDEMKAGDINKDF